MQYKHHIYVYVNIINLVLFIIKYKAHLWLGTLARANIVMESKRGVARRRRANCATGARVAWTRAGCLYLDTGTVKPEIFYSI